jgi:ACS family pantothenate transporter-like MFS transporter
MSGVLSRLVEVIRWYPKDMPANERRLVHKIDLLVLSYACLSFFTKYLDVSALSMSIHIPSMLSSLTFNEDTD